jgi:hypothetical protein
LKASLYGTTFQPLSRPQAFLHESATTTLAQGEKSIEARSDNNGRTWSVKLFDTGRLTEYTGGTLGEVDALAAKHGMTLVQS